MFNIKSIVKFFISDEVLVTEAETLDFYEAQFKSNQGISFDRENFGAVLSNNYYDDLKITISLDDNPFSLLSSNVTENIFWEKVTELFRGADSEDEFVITVYVKKLLHDKVLLNIYNLDLFRSYLKELDVVDVLSIFNAQFVKVNNALVLYSTDIKMSFSTDFIHFSNSETISKLLPYPDYNRNKKVEKIKNVSHFYGLENAMLLPEDFYLRNDEIADVIIEDIFNKSCMVLLLASIFDYVILADKSINITLKGYKVFTSNIKVDEIKTACLKEYFSIYEWIFQNGSINDKIGLSRNLISLNVDKTDCYSIDNSVQVSILSGFKVYEQQNVKQYIELRNKMSDQIMSFNEKASKIVDNFASGFQKSALTFVSLFSSIFIVRVLTAHDFENVFTFDATIISIAFLAVSLLYFFISFWELTIQKTRYVTSYQGMKKRNTDLLTDDDISKILDEDSEFKKDLIFIDDKRNKYSVLWIGSIIIFLLVVLFLYFKRSTPIEIKSTNSIKDSVKQKVIINPKIDTHSMLEIPFIDSTNKGKNNK